MLRKFKFWCMMYAENIRHRYLKSEGFRVKDIYLSDICVWCIDVDDIIENVSFTYELRFARHHDRTDFIVSEYSKNGVCVEVYQFTDKLDREISDYIIKKVG